MPANFIRHHIVDTSWVPWWVTGPNRGRVLYSIGLALDTLIQRAQDGVLQRFPSFCAPDALSWIGRDRQIRRGYAESIDGYRARLLKWRSIHRRDGMAWSILQNIQGYFAPQKPVVRLVTGGTTAAQWWTIDSAGNETFARRTPSNWDWDSQDPNTATLDTQRRFHVIVYQDPSDPRSIFKPIDDPAPPPAPTLSQGSTGSVLAARDLSLLASERQMGGSWLGGVIVVFDSTLFLPTGSGAGYPDGTWYRYSDPATYLPVRPANTRYFHDRRRPGLFSEGLESILP